MCLHCCNIYVSRRCLAQHLRQGIVSGSSVKAVAAGAASPRREASAADPTDGAELSKRLVHAHTSHRYT